MALCRPVDEKCDSIFAAPGQSDTGTGIVDALTGRFETDTGIGVR